MPFSDDLVRCDECRQMVLWSTITRENSHKWCPKCAKICRGVGERKNLYKEGANEENKTSV